MKKFLCIAVSAALIVVLLFTAPTTLAEAKTKLPKNGQKFYSQTFAEHDQVRKGDGYWIVKKIKGKKMYQPVIETDEAIIHAQNMYVQIGKRTYYCDGDGYISWSNPDGYKVAKAGYIIFPKEEPEPTKTEPEPTKTDPEPTKTEPEPTTIPSPGTAAMPTGYVVKDDYGILRCYDAQGNNVIGRVGLYYFSSYGMETGLVWLEDGYHWFSTGLDDFGQMKTGWIQVADSKGCLMYFDPSSGGKALTDQQIVCSDGHTYAVDSSGFLVTGWWKGNYYSAEIDRYGQLIAIK